MQAVINGAKKMGFTVDLSRSSRKLSGTMPASCSPALLLQLDPGTPENKFKLAVADEGNAQATEAFIFQAEVPSTHPKTKYTNDYSSAFDTGDPDTVVQHEIGKPYILKTAGITGAIGEKLRCAAAGLAQKYNAAHNDTLKYVHTWALLEKYGTSSVYVIAMYLGILPCYTTTTP